MALNADGVLATGGDNGSLWFWDWRSGNAFQQSETIVQPGSLDSEAGLCVWKGGSASGLGAWVGQQLETIVQPGSLDREVFL